VKVASVPPGLLEPDLGRRLIFRLPRIVENKIRSCELLKPEAVLRPVLPRRSCEVSTIGVLMFLLLFEVESISIELGQRKYRNRSPRDEQLKIIMSFGAVVFFSLLRKRLQFGEDDRQVFRDRGMNVHGTLDDCVRRLCIHHVQQNVNHFIASDSKNRSS
jgi:hypothetical protein